MLWYFKSQSYGDFMTTYENLKINLKMFCNRAQMVNIGLWNRRHEKLDSHTKGVGPNIPQKF